MSYRRKICFILALMLCWEALPAQNVVQRIAVVDLQGILSQLPSYRQAEKYLSGKQAGWEDEINALISECDSLERDYQAEKVLLTTEMSRVRQAGISGKKARIDTLSDRYFGPSGEYIKEKQRLLAPILEAIKLEINNYCEKNRINIVLDKSEMTVLYFDKFSDISQAIINRLKKDN